MLALDRPTKSIVVAIRGTVSVADLATDMLADPEPMEEWLPDTMTEVRLHHIHIPLFLACDLRSAREIMLKSERVRVSTVCV